MKLDLACGVKKQPGFLGVDLFSVPGVDIVCDLKEPWPFKDDSVDEAFCSHFFEHLTGPERIKFMDELYRVLKSGAKTQIITPYWTSMRSVQDPYHAWPPVCEASFLYFNKTWREQNGLEHYLGKCDFDFSYGYGVAPLWQQRHMEAQQFAIANYTNAVMDLHVTVIKRVVSA